MKTFKRFIKEKIELPRQQGLGFSRKEMPQVEGKNVTKFLAYLQRNGVSYKEKVVDSKKLKPTQNQFNQTKIQTMIDVIDTKKQHPIMVSNDGFVIDGHHRWLAHYNLGKKLPVIEIDLKIHDALDMMHEFPLSTTRNMKEQFDMIILESGETCPVISISHMKAFEKLVDRLFDKFGIDFDFTKHFRERMSDERNKPCIDMKELASIIQKIYKRKSAGQNIFAKHVDTEVVLKDIQSDLNIPIAIEYDRKNDDLRVIAKTVMRKKNFRTPNPVLKI
jgi:hypothetical protein